PFVLLTGAMKRSLKTGSLDREVLGLLPNPAIAVEIHHLGHPGCRWLLWLLWGFFWGLWWVWG
ncbi:MAG: hypothetical protein QGI51_03055, partial [Dehalococcoidales bacterium]|nr:hypothetical protein [Dehalococcoidales bacterium]